MEILRPAPRSVDDEIDILVKDNKYQIIPVYVPVHVPGRESFDPEMDPKYEFATIVSVNIGDYSVQVSDHSFLMVSSKPYEYNSNKVIEAYKSDNPNYAQEIKELHSEEAFEKKIQFHHYFKNYPHEHGKTNPGSGQRNDLPTHIKNLLDKFKVLDGAFYSELRGILINDMPVLKEMDNGTSMKVLDELCLLLDKLGWFDLTTYEHRWDKVWYRPFFI